MASTKQRTPAIKLTQPKPEQEIVCAIEPIEWWTGILAVATVLAAIFAGFTLNAIRDQLAEMKTEQRAWVGTVGMEIAQPIKLGESIKSIVHIINTGHTPAVNVNHFGAYDAHDAGTANADVMLTQEMNNFQSNCFSLTKSDVGTVVLPSEFRPTDINWPPYTLKTPPVYTSDIINGTKILIVLGCIVYLSGDDVHHTAFCFYYWKGHAAESALPFCGHGNAAN